MQSKIFVKMLPPWILAILLTVAVCTASEGPRINGGEDTTIEKYSSVVQVESSTALVWGQSCAGAILTPRFIMSAAQCFRGTFFSPSRRRIRAGSARRNRGGVVIGVRRVFNHPDYSASTGEFDLSLVELNAAFVYSTTIRNAKIVPQNFYLPAYLPVREVGWGSTRASGSGTSNTLQEVTVYTLPQSTCAEQYKNLSSSRAVTEHTLCTGGVEGRGACDGDEGGPVFYDDIVVGVISSNHLCGDGTVPNINTRVASFTNWIIINVS